MGEAEAHVCPRCGGERRIYNGTTGNWKPCSTCEGEGVVWDRAPQEAAEQQPGEAVTDLTYTPE